MFSHGFPMFSHGFPMVSPQETFVSSHESSSPELRGEALLRDSTLRLLHRSKKESERERDSERERGCHMFQLQFTVLRPGRLTTYKWTETYFPVFVV